MKIGQKKADCVEVQLVGNNTILLITQENDMNPSKLDTVLIVDVSSINNLIAKLEEAKKYLKG